MGALGADRLSGVVGTHPTALVLRRGTGRLSQQWQRADAGAELAADLPAVTLATQCSLDRWPRFERQAASWQGPVSVAVYVPCPAGTRGADAAVQLLRQRAAAFAAAHPQPLAVSALFALCYAREGLSALAEAGLSAAHHPLLVRGAAGTDAASGSSTPTPWAELYPINALRNAALTHVATPLVLPIDADFVLSAGLAGLLHQRPGPYAQDLSQLPGEPRQMAPQRSLAQQLVRRSRLLQLRPLQLLLPPFQLAPREAQPDGHSPGCRTKAELRAALAEGRVVPFDCGVFSPAQQPLDVLRWLDASQPFGVAYCDLFEAHAGIAALSQLPRYSEAFRGYGLNKQAHAAHAAALGFEFWALPDGFVVTAPHSRPTSWRPTPGSAADEAHLARIWAVYGRFKERLAQLAPPGQG